MTRPRYYADALDKVGAYSAAVIDSGERCHTWYLQRNFATRGTRAWDAAGHPTAQVFKAKKPKGRTSEYAVEIEDQDFRELALLWRAFTHSITMPW